MGVTLEALPPAAQAILGAFGTGMVGILIFLWRAYREYRRDQREEEKANADRETQRRERQDRGFAVLDQNRDREIKRLGDEIDSMAKRHAAEIVAIRLRATEDLAVAERANVRKRGEIAHLEKRLAEVSDNRDEGWDKGRMAEEIGRQYRHDLVNLIVSVHAAGKYGAPMPAALQRIYEAGQAGQPIPAAMVPRVMPPLQHMQRKPPPAASDAGWVDASGPSDGGSATD